MKHEVGSYVSEDGTRGQNLVPETIEESSARKLNFCRTLLIYFLGRVACPLDHIYLSSIILNLF